MTSGQRHGSGRSTRQTVDPDHRGTRGDTCPEDRPDEISVQIQRVDHESCVHIDIETDDIPAEVARLEKLGATVNKQLERWVVMRAPSGRDSSWFAFTQACRREYMGVTPAINSNLPYTAY